MFTILHQTQPQLDFATYPPQLVWLAITFTLMFIIMWKVAVPKISDALEARQMRFEENLKKAEDLKREAEATLAAYENALAEARAEAHNQIVKIQADLQKAAAKEEEELNEKLDAKLASSLPVWGVSVDEQDKHRDFLEMLSKKAEIVHWNKTSS